MAEISANPPEQRVTESGLSVMALLQWALFGLCVLALLFTVWRYAAFVQEVQTLQTEIQQRNDTIKKQETTIRNNTEKLDRLSSSSAMAAMTVRDLEQTIEQNSSICGNAAQVRQTFSRVAVELNKAAPSDVSRFLTVANDLCVNADQRGEAETAFLLPYGQAVNARVQGQFDVAASAYRDAINRPNFASVGPDWQMRAYEGLAYALMQNGDDAGASAAIEKSLQAKTAAGDPIGQKYVFARLTEIKLMCRQKAAPEQVQRAFSSARNTLVLATQQESDAARSYYRLDLGYLEQDRELYRTCAYAHLARS